MGALFDVYELRARLKPALIVIVPVVLAVLAWFPEQATGWGVLTSVLSTFGLTALAARLARDLGKRKEPVLHSIWGGRPTTIALRFRHTWLDKNTFSRWRRKIGSLVPDIVLPSEQEELERPTAADRAYEGCSRHLREVTRDRKRFRLVFAENINYGFRRNLWGMKPAGALLSTLGMVACSAAVFAPAVGYQANQGIALVSLAVNAALLVLWLFRVNPGWVRVPADAYAESLLGACETLD